MKEIDTEVDLIKRVHEDLKTLSPQAQQRVLDYLRSKFSDVVGPEASPSELKQGTFTHSNPRTFLTGKLKG